MGLLSGRTVTMASRAIVSKRKEASKTGENFKVAVRVRPLIAREIRSNASLVSSAVWLNSVVNLIVNINTVHYDRR